MAGNVICLVHRVSQVGRSDIPDGLILNFSVERCSSSFQTAGLKTNDAISPVHYVEFCLLYFELLLW